MSGADVPHGPVFFDVRVRRRQEHWSVVVDRILKKKFEIRIFELYKTHNPGGRSRVLLHERFMANWQTVNFGKKCFVL